MKQSSGFAVVPAEVLQTGNGYAIAVYAAIAKHADRNGVAYPSIKTLSEITGWSRPTIDKAVAMLAEAGVLNKERRYKNGVNRANQYNLKCSQHRVRTDSSDASDVGNDVEKPANVQMATSLPTYVTSDELVRKEVSNGTQGGFHEQEPVEQYPVEQDPPPTPDAHRERFDRFWSAFPKRVGKAKAWEWWKRHTPDDDMLASMLAAIASQRRSRQWQKDGGQYIPHPMTWLNRGGWEDELEGENDSFPPWFVLKPGEKIEQVGEGCWDITGPDGRQRKIRPQYHGAVWDERLHTSIDGQRKFSQEVLKQQESERRVS